MQTNLKVQSDDNLSLFNKPLTISERLAEAAKSTFVGRKTERALISNAVGSAVLPFMVAYLHGPGGIGKSRLLQAALSDIGPEVGRYIMDCREIEPTPLGCRTDRHRAGSITTRHPANQTSQWLRDRMQSKASDRVVYRYRSVN